MHSSVLNISAKRETSPYRFLLTASTEATNATGVVKSTMLGPSIFSGLLQQKAMGRAIDSPNPTTGMAQRNSARFGDGSRGSDADTKISSACYKSQYGFVC